MALLVPEEEQGAQGVSYTNAGGGGGDKEHHKVSAWTGEI